MSDCGAELILILVNITISVVQISIGLKVKAMVAEEPEVTIEKALKATL